MAKGDAAKRIMDELKEIIPPGRHNEIESDKKHIDQILRNAAACDFLKVMEDYRTLSIRSALHAVTALHEKDLSGAAQMKLITEASGKALALDLLETFAEECGCSLRPLREGERLS